MWNKLFSSRQNGNSNGNGVWTPQSGASLIELHSVEKAYDTAAGEFCDDGGESATCDIDCSAVSCGDSVVNTTAGETCDDGGESATCDVDCTTVQCGDGVVSAHITLLEVLPAYQGRGIGAELRNEVGVASVGGILISGVLTLLVMPILYDLFTRKNGKAGPKK